ncbi:MAG: tetratricopeptide repeat protein [Candidatus Vecturithrix sp.]|nr:tetratricopeptide repeat protein [Candidatus Vecturithrix sp.]
MKIVRQSHKLKTSFYPGCNKRIRWFRRLSLLLASVFIAGTLGAAANEGAPQQTLLMAQQALYEGSFDQALTRFAAIIQDYPDDPKGYLFLAVAYRWLTRIDPGSAQYQEQFEQAANRSIKKALSLIKENPNNAEATLYLAASYGYRAEYYNFLKKSWGKAYDDGVKMQEYLKKAQKFSHIPLDIQLGYGLYNYYAYLYREKIGWWRFLLSLPKGDKKKGLELLEKVREEGSYANIEAWYFLIEIYKDERNPELRARARVLSEELRQKYPHNPFFHILLAGVYHKQHDWQRSIQTAQEILTQANTQPYYSDYLIYQAKYLIGESSFFLGQNEQALQTFDEIIAFQPKQPTYLLPWAHLRRGTIYSLTGQQERATVEFQLILKMEDVLHVHELARALLERQRQHQN